MEETCTNVVTTLVEQPSLSAVGGANTLEGGNLAAIQGVPKFHQVMNKFPPSIIAENLLEGCENLPLHDQVSIHIADLEQHNCTTLCNLELIKEGMNHNPNVPLLSCTPHLGLRCEFLEDRMNLVPNKLIQNHLFILELEHETAKTPWRILTALSISSIDEAFPS